MRTVYVVDKLRVFTGEVLEIDLATPIKRNWILTPPPETDGYHIWDGVKWFSRDEYPHPPPLPPSEVMSHLEFLRKFTLEERTQLRNAAKTDPVLDDSLFLFQSAKEIDLYDDDTQKFFQYMIAEGLLSEERLEQIMNGEDYENL